MRVSYFLAKVAAAALLLGAPLASAEPLSVAGKPKVTFSATGNPGFLDIEGETHDLRLADDGTDLVFSVGMKTVTTGIDLRDEHMNEKYVEVARFPEVNLAIPRAALALPANVGEAKDGKVTARFTAHGVTRDVEVTYSVKRSKTGYRVQASFPFDVSAHGIAIPSYLSVTVDPKMQARVTFDLADAP